VKTRLSSISRVRPFGSALGLKTGGVADTGGKGKKAAFAAEVVG
jgi:hypothetical protein